MYEDARVFSGKIIRDREKLKSHSSLSIIMIMMYPLVVYWIGRVYSVKFQRIKKDDQPGRSILGTMGKQ
jgi:hypothetical protein